jgi:hypothetical protein
VFFYLIHPEELYSFLYPSKILPAPPAHCSSLKLDAVPIKAPKAFFIFCAISGFAIIQLAKSINSCFVANFDKSPTGVEGLEELEGVTGGFELELEGDEVGGLLFTVELQDEKLNNNKDNNNIFFI